MCMCPVHVSSDLFAGELREMAGHHGLDFRHWPLRHERTRRLVRTCGWTSPITRSSRRATKTGGVQAFFRREFEESDARPRPDFKQ